MSSAIARLYNWVTDKANGVKITASRQDAELDQLVLAANRKVLCATSAPGSPITGQSWVDTSLTPPVLKTYNGSTWDVVGHATGANIASASSVTFGSDGDTCNITGTTTITAFASMPAGTIRVVTFTGALTLTHNATSLILPNAGSNITTAAGDVAVFLSLGSGNWKCLIYQPLAGNSGMAAASQAEMEAASSTAKAVTPGRTQYHPGVAKAWVRFNGTGTIAIIASHNVTSLTDNGTGDYSINLTTAFSASTAYCLVGCAGPAGSGGQSVGQKTASATAPRIEVSVSGSFGDYADVDVAMFGDQ